MKTLMISAVAIVIALAITGCAGIKTINYETLPGGSPTVVIVGVYKAPPEQMKSLQDAFPGSVVIIPREYFPPSSFMEDVLAQLKEKSLKGPFIFIGYSWSGRGVRDIDAANPGLVKAVVTIGTVMGKLKFVPEFISDIAFRPDDDHSQTPLFVICGFKEDLVVERWWIKDKKRSDGLADVDSIMDTGRRAVAGRAVFDGNEHHQVLDDPRAIKQLQVWLEPYLNKNNKAALAVGK